MVVIDEDLGRSGSGVQQRPGFGRLLAAVCQGLAGAVLALEASRLARNNRDWHHLVDLCALTATVLIDDDGIYDPKLLNDRFAVVIGWYAHAVSQKGGWTPQRESHRICESATVGGSVAPTCLPSTGRQFCGASELARGGKMTLLGISHALILMGDWCGPASDTA